MEESRYLMITKPLYFVCRSVTASEKNKKTIPLTVKVGLYMGPCSAFGNFSPR